MIRIDLRNVPSKQIKEYSISVPDSELDKIDKIHFSIDLLHNVEIIDDIEYNNLNNKFLDYISRVIAKHDRKGHVFMKFWT